LDEVAGLMPCAKSLALSQQTTHLLSQPCVLVHKSAHLATSRFFQHAQLGLKLRNTILLPLPVSLLSYARHVLLLFRP
jgi:hypothetical protein